MPMLMDCPDSPSPTVHIDSWLEDISEVQVSHASATNSTSAANNPTAEFVMQ